jgi:hypothetical protein
MMSEEQRDVAIALLRLQSRGVEVTMQTIEDECAAREILDPDPIRLLLLQEAPAAQWAAGLRRKVLVRTGKYIRLTTPGAKLIAVNSPAMQEAMHLWSQVSGAEVLEPNAPI